MVQVTWLASGLAPNVTGIERFVIALLDDLSSHGVLDPGDLTVVCDPTAQWAENLRAMGAGLLLRPHGEWWSRKSRAKHDLIHSFGHAPFPTSGAVKIFSVYDWGPIRDSTLTWRARFSWTQAIWRGLRDADWAHYLNPVLPADQPTWLPRPRASIVSYPSSRLARSSPVESKGGHLTKDLTASKGYGLFVGTCMPRKRIGLVSTMARQTSQDVVLVGDGTEEYAGEHVFALGRVSDDILDAVYEGASALILVSEYEGFGIPVLEAAARGIVSVVSYEVLSTLPEELASFCIAVDPHDSKMFSEAIDRARELRGRKRYEGDPLRGLRRLYAQLLGLVE